MPDHLALRRRERPGHLVVEQLGALAQRGERGLQLVRHVAQEAVLLRLELVEPPAQPVQPSSQIAQVFRPAHRDRLREVGAAELADRAVDLADRARDVARQRERDRQRHRGAEDQQQDDVALDLLGAVAQPLDLAVDHAVVDRHHVACAVDQRVDAVRHGARVDAPARLGVEQVVESLLVLHGDVERVRLRIVERQLRDLGGELLEAAVHARIVGGEPRVVEQRHLLRDALDRGDAVDERAAGARRLRGVEHRGAALAREALGVPRRVGERADQRQDHQREAGEQQPQEGARVKNPSV